MPKEDTQFTSELGRIAGVKSGLTRRPIDKERAAKRAYNYSVELMDMIATQIFVPTKCDKCKRGGPIDSRTLDGLARSLLTLIEAIQSRAWGKPATESRIGREATLEDFKRAAREVKAAVGATDVPNDLPPPPE